MAVFLFWLAVVTLLAVVATAVEFSIGNRSFHSLLEFEPPKEADAPSVSVVIAARNEAKNIEEALTSVLRQDYPKLEIIVVNDRSTDATGEILSRLSAKHLRLKVLQITDLPGGWLGKTHALQRGADIATGDLLLFTDGDVVMEPSTIGRAVSYLCDRNIDHLTVAPRMNMPGLLLGMFAGAFILFFGMFIKPWKARDPKSARHIGIGAFNLVRADVYRKIGGHKPIALRPDDDLKFGKLIKKTGHRQDVAGGADLVSVEWYSSLGEVVRGLEKNSFAGLEYNLLFVVGATLGQFLMFVWPALALVFTKGATLWLNLAILVLLAILYADNIRYQRLPRWHGIGLPLTSALFIYIVWRATIKALVNRGIDWRGTHYPLSELKANKV